MGRLSRARGPGPPLNSPKKDATTWYPEIVQALQKVRGSFILDGEVCLLDEHGIPNFEEMRSRAVRKRGELVTYFAFDLLFLNGRDLRTCRSWSVRRD